MKKNILVTAVGGRSVGSGILHALTRCAPDVCERWNVIGADADSFAWGLYKVVTAVLLPLANAPDYLDKVKAIVSEYKIDAIIPGSEPEVNFLSGKLDEFDIPIICNAHELMPLMTDKFETAKKIFELGLPSIETFELVDWKEALSKYNFPIILKPTKGTGGSKGVFICTNQGELDTFLYTLPESAAYCIQPIVGSDEDEYTVGILNDKDGNLIDSIVIKRKLIGLSLLDSKSVDGKKYSISTGYSQGFVIKHAKIQKFCEDLAMSIGSKGPLNIQLRLVDGKIYVFEIHTRFSGTTPIRADVNFNEPDIMLRSHLFAEKFGRLDYQFDVAAIRAFEHVIVPINQMLK